MSDFTNDMRYPKRGSVQFDTKDRIDILISKTGGDRSMNIVYSDPETGEVIQSGGGGGGATLVPMTITENADNSLTYTIQMAGSALFSLMKTGVPVVSSEQAGEETIGYISRAIRSSDGFCSFYLNRTGEEICLDSETGEDYPTFTQS